MPRPWTVLSHAPLEKLQANLWSVESALPKSPIRRRMGIARFADGRLLFLNAIPLDEPSMKEIEAWGTPAFAMAGNGFHRLDLRYDHRLGTSGNVRLALTLGADESGADIQGDSKVGNGRLRSAASMAGCVSTRSWITSNPARCSSCTSNSVSLAESSTINALSILVMA